MQTQASNEIETVNCDNASNVSIVATVEQSITSCSTYFRDDLRSQSLDGCKKIPPHPRVPDIFHFFTNGWEFL